MSMSFLILINCYDFSLCLLTSCLLPLLNHRLQGSCDYLVKAEMASAHCPGGLISCRTESRPLFMKPVLPNLPQIRHLYFLSCTCIFLSSTFTPCPKWPVKTVYLSQFWLCSSFSNVLFKKKKRESSMAALITAKDATMISSLDDWNSLLPDFPVFTLDSALLKGSQKDPRTASFKKRDPILSLSSSNSKLTSHNTQNNI